MRSPSNGALYSSNEPLRFHENATSRPSGERSIPPQKKSTLGSPASVSTARRSTGRPSETGRYADATGWMSRSQFGTDRKSVV